MMKTINFLCKFQDVCCAIAYVVMHSFAFVPNQFSTITYENLQEKSRIYEIRKIHFINFIRSNHI